MKSFVLSRPERKYYLQKCPLNGVLLLYDKLVSELQRELEETLHRMELENTRLDMALQHEKDKSAQLNKECTEARQVCLQTRLHQLADSYKYSFSKCKGSSLENLSVPLLARGQRHCATTQLAADWHKLTVQCSRPLLVLTDNRTRGAACGHTSSSVSCTGLRIS